MKLEIFLLVLISGSTIAFPSGAPSWACRKMQPFVGVHGTESNELMPYQLTCRLLTSTTIEVGISGVENDVTFKGFIIQIQDSSGQQIGNFEQFDAGKAKFMSRNDNDVCSSHSLTHRNSQPKDEVIVQAKFDEEVTASDIRCVFTVVQVKTTHWDGIIVHPTTD